MLFVIKAALALISWLLAQFLLPRLGVTKDTPWVSLLAALLVLASTEATDYIATLQADPELTVTATHPKSGELHLKVSKKAQLVNRLDIMYQVLGRVKSVQDSMAKTSVSTITKQGGLVNKCGNGVRRQPPVQWPLRVAELHPHTARRRTRLAVTLGH